MVDDVTFYWWQSSNFDIFWASQLLSVLVSGKLDPLEYVSHILFDVDFKLHHAHVIIIRSVFEAC
jgi:hypothetical protein